MKKITILVITAFAIMAATVCAKADNDRPIAVSELPAPAQKFLKKHFPDIEVSYAKVDEEFLDKDYKVVMVDGTAVEFGRGGEWKSVDSKYGRVPESVVPEMIREHLAKNFPNRKITAIDRDRRDYEVELDDDVDLKYDLKFRFMGVGD